MSRIHFVGGEKGGVGKSVMARLLAQYFVDRAMDWRGFDTDASHGALLRYYGSYSQPVDADRLEELDEIIESVEAGREEVVVDLAAQTERAVERWVESAEVMPFLEQLGHRVYYCYVLDDGKDSTELLEQLLERVDARCKVVAVRNLGRGQDFMLFEKARLADRIAGHGGCVVDLPKLHYRSMLKIDAYDKSFWAAVYNTDPAEGACLSLMERQRVQVFVRRAHALIREILNGG